jgi:hypothetical protein
LFILGHVGVGTRLLGRLRERLPARWLVFGCLLPDLIDKPLFYGLLWSRGHPDPLISGSRSVGHSGLFLVALLALALLSRRASAWALFAGVGTHLILDLVGELVAGARPESSIWLAILFPLLGWRFPKARFGSLLEHLQLSAENAYVVGGELIGGAILLSAWWRRRRMIQSS